MFVYVSVGNLETVQSALMLSSIVLFNAATPQARKEDAVEHLQVWGKM